MERIKCQEENQTISRLVKINGHKMVETIHADDGTKVYQPVLVDKSSTGKVRPWAEKKTNNEKLAKIFDYLGSTSTYDSEYYFKRAERLRNCAVFLKFRVIDNNGLLKLKKMNNSCRVRLCPVCAWRRTLKISSHARKIFTHIETDEEHKGKYDYLFLTLTVPNCWGYQLSDAIEHLMKSFDRLMKRRELKRIVVGWYRGLEVTFNKYEFITNGLYQRCKYYFDARGLKVGDKNPNFNTYHPHFHVILVVPKSYLNNPSSERGYLTNAKWLEIWRECARDNSITQVDIRPVRPGKKTKTNINSNDPLQKNGLVNTICEVTKYPLKDSEYIIPWDWDLSADCVATLDKALFKRRLVAWGGLLKDVHRRLNLDDELDGDLVNIDDDTPSIPGSDIITEFSAFWHVGFQEYVVYDIQEKTRAEALAEEKNDSLYNSLKSLGKKSKPNKIGYHNDSISTSEFTFDVPSDEEEQYNDYVKSIQDTSLPESDNQLELF